MEKHEIGATDDDSSHYGEPVGRVNLQRDGGTRPALGWTRRNILLGIGAIIIMLLSLYIILQGVFQATPAP